jgi:glycosyltransferase involved in cell wall biosynthesis
LEFAGKKVLIIDENLCVPFDRRVWKEARFLKRSGAQVFVISPKGRGYTKSFEVIEGINIYRHPLGFEGKSFLGYISEYSLALLWEFILSWKIFFKHGFKVIHACNPPDLIFLIALFFKPLGVQFVFDHHDICPELYRAKTKKDNFVYRLLLLFERLTFRTADIVISTNDSYKDIALARGRVPPENIFIVGNTPELEALQKYSGKSIKATGISDYTIGYIGVMGKQDGLTYLIDAAAYLVKEKGLKNIQFVLIGEGPEYHFLKEYARQSGLDDVVRFTGRISDEEAFSLLGKCDICVNPDEVNEFNSKSSMTKILEYMALGKPIVQFDMPESKYLSQQASLYAQANDARDLAEKIYFLLNDDALRQEMSEYGKRRVADNFQWRFSEAELGSAYRKAFGY